MPDNVVSFDGFTLERCYFPLGRSGKTYDRLCQVLDTLNDVIGEAEDAIGQHRHSKLVAGDSERVATLRLATELIDGCLK